MVKKIMSMKKIKMCRFSCSSSILVLDTEMIIKMINMIKFINVINMIMVIKMIKINNDG